MPSLKLQELLRSAAARAGFGAVGGGVSGLCPSAAALFAASAATRDARHDVVLLVVPTDRDVEQATSDVRFFLGGLEGSTGAELDQAVRPFPSQEVDPYRGLTPHLRVTSARAGTLHALAAGHARVVVASATALLPRVSPPAEIVSTALELRPGTEIDPLQLAARLIHAGFTRQDPVEEHGAFCVRGGVADIFPAGEDQPARVEFVGDTVEMIRRFDPATQRSISPIDQLRIVPLRDWLEDRGPGDGIPGSEPQAAGLQPPATHSSVFSYFSLSRRPVILVSEPDAVRERVATWLAQVAESHADAIARPEGARGTRLASGSSPGSVLPAPAAILIDWPEIERHLRGAVTLNGLFVEEFNAGEGTSESVAADQSSPEVPGRDTPSSHITCQPARAFAGRLSDWVHEVKRARALGDTVIFVAATPGRAERIVELLNDYELRAVQIDRGEDAYAASVLVTTGLLSRGFRLPAAGFLVYAETDVFEEERPPAERRRSAARAFLSDLRDLKPGDFVVHVDHGIGVFVGLRQLGVGATTYARPSIAQGGTASSPDGPVQEFLELRYSGDDKLFVPVDRLDFIQKYTGGARPTLDRLGGASWEKAKQRVKKAMRDMAEELLKLYAARKAIAGHAFPADTHWQEEFENAFPWDLTVDQAAAVEDIKRDMESSTPMDRLLCGDVGYGKTEVAMRAAFKTVMDGKQVAFLAPTTVLAFQHAKTLRERFSGFPIRIDVVSRFRTPAEQKATLADLAEGRVDCLVGTHRLLSKDVAFRDLGLLVIDEEQRFGVAHKERIKQMRKKVDVLTMTATPIPRTLNMSLVGIRDMSIIETPPKDRLAIQTNVVKFSQPLITRAIRAELARGGQVYFVHNRVESIYAMGNLITRLVPEARVVVGHGQMGEHELEQAMIGFVGQRYDILLATTIVENGLDIPNVNTIIINRADRYGLAQLYQLRGRVGRSDRPAYAYLLVPPEDNLSTVAKKRLAAIREFSDLGSGFRVAALDLEIRGAGNLLGGEQSGQIDAVGFEMYMKLLDQTVRELKGEEVEDEARATVNLGVDLRISEDYVTDMSQRLVLYRRVAAARTDQELTRIVEEIRDRYGPLPESLLALEAFGRIRLMADRLGVESLDRQGSTVVLTFRQDGRRTPDPARIIRIVTRRDDLQLVPPGTLKLRLGAKARHLDGPQETATSRPTAGGGPFPGPRISPPPPVPQRWRTRGESAGTTGRPVPPKSWWTTRATAGEVTPGFSKEEILRPQRDNPLGPAGVFTRVADLLSALLG
jgi:transcription-repair coupling factor (superfamily II helicase)